MDPKFKQGGICIKLSIPGWINFFTGNLGKFWAAGCPAITIEQIGNLCLQPHYVGSSPTETTCERSFSVSGFTGFLLWFLTRLSLKWDPRPMPRPSTPLPPSFHSLSLSHTGTHKTVEPATGNSRWLPISKIGNSRVEKNQCSSLSNSLRDTL